MAVNDAPLLECLGMSRSIPANTSSVQLRVHSANELPRAREVMGEGPKGRNYFCLRPFCLDKLTLGRHVFPSHNQSSLRMDN